jgi:uncharacterized membrane protein/uncharacterized membrane protein YeaQ/YmgE (transglycosylase-associated protein family)
VSQAITWIATGLLVGWLTRTALQSRREFGLFGDLITGSLGAVVGGWLVRRLDIVTPDNLPAHVVVSIIGAMVLLIALRMLRRGLGAGLPSTAQLTLGGELDEQIKKLSALQRKILTNVLGKGAPPDPNLTFDQQLTFGQRVADHVASFGGSWAFIGMFLTGMVLWMSINSDTTAAFDPYPYILLNLVLSCVAALQAPVIMMSQNRQNARDRIDARNDYEVNLRAEIQIVALHAKLDAARDQEWAQMAEHIVMVNKRLSQIETVLERSR